MAYLHIPNLYKDQSILYHRECYAMEKIHGTSAHISYKEGKLHFFSGGEKHENFVALFDEDTLRMGMAEIAPEITVFGEAYGGKCQGMKHTYGDALRFVAFEVKIGDTWLAVPQAEDVCNKLHLPFVYYKRVSTDLAVLDAERDADSEQAKRNGVGPGKMREGIVLRPLEELRKNNGERVIAKHKRDEFKETATPRPVQPGKLEVVAEANRVAQEWVTEMRLAHVLDKCAATDIKDTGKVIAAMVEDVRRESAGEVAWSPEVRGKIGARTAQLFKRVLHDRLQEKSNEQQAQVEAT